MAEEAFQEQFTSYSEAVDQLEQAIDTNFNALGSFIDQMQLTNPDEQANYKLEYDQYVAYYYQALTNARTVGEAGTDEEKQQCLNDLKVIYDWSNDILATIGAQIPQYEDPEFDPSGETAMMTGEGTTEPYQDDVVDVQPSTGMIDSFWSGISPEFKTLFKVGAIAAVIWGGVKLWEAWQKITAKSDEEFEEEFLGEPEEEYEEELPEEPPEIDLLPEME